MAKQTHRQKYGVPQSRKNPALKRSFTKEQMADFPTRHLIIPPDPEPNPQTPPARKPKTWRFLFCKKCKGTSLKEKLNSVRQCPGCVQAAKARRKQAAQAKKDKLKNPFQAHLSDKKGDK